MVKKISAVALSALLSLPVAAFASGDRVQDLEKQMAEMSRTFNAKMQAMQDQISALKSKKQQAPATKEAAASSPADWTKKVSLSGLVRVRGYDFNNFWDFNSDNNFDQWNAFRVKGSLTAKVQATDDVTAVITVTDQNWGEGLTYTKTEMDNTSNKMFLDNAYINIRNLFSLPVDLTLGRQNVKYGSGFVILDGQSQFASTSIYFDGVKMRWNINDNMMLDGLYLKDQEGTDRGGSGDDITLAGFYFTNKQCPLTGMRQELYALNRNDQTLSKNIWMYGIRLSDKMDNGIDYSLEGAIQRGDANANQDQDAWGCKLDAGYTFKQVVMKPRLYVGYAFMSGDDANTNDNEGWDVFYGGWPQFGDLLAWKYVNIGPANALANVYNYNGQSSTSGEAPYSNLKIATIGASANLIEDFSVKISYSNLKFDQTYVGIDDDLGDYYQAKLCYKYNKNLSFALYSALIDPGKAFSAPADDNATEVYWETMYKF